MNQQDSKSQPAPNHPEFKARDRVRINHDLGLLGIVQHGVINLDEVA